MCFVIFSVARICETENVSPISIAVVPLLMQALQKVGKERPEDPITAIIEFLDANNPKKKQRTE